MPREHCARCGRFIGEDCLEGHDGTFFGRFPDDDGYTGVYYCAWGVGCNSDEAVLFARVDEK